MTLEQAIFALETDFPKREWLLRRDTEHNGYFASSVPIGYTPVINRSNPCIIKARGPTPNRTLSALYDAVAKYEDRNAPDEC